MPREQVLDGEELAALAAEVLARGGSLPVRARGASMWPAIRPGDALVLSPVPARGPAPGDIAVWRRHGQLVAHRVISVDHGELRTAADAGATPDPPLPLDCVLGVVSRVQPSRGSGPRRRRALVARLVGKLIGATAARALRRAVPFLVLLLAVFSAVPAARAQTCIVPTTSNMLINGVADDWNRKCQYQVTDPLHETNGPPGRDVQWFGFTHTASGDNVYFAFRTDGPPTNPGTTFQTIIRGSGGATITLTTSRAGPNWQTTATVSGGGGTFLVTTEAVDKVIEFGGANLAMALGGVAFQTFTIEFGLLPQGMTVGDAITPLTGVSPTAFPALTAVLLSRFSACPTRAGVQLAWDTSSETDTIGFFVRRGSPTGPRVSEQMIPGQLTSPVGGRYRLVDPLGRAGTAYFLEENARDGAHIYGPAVLDCDAEARSAARRGADQLTPNAASWLDRLRRLARRPLRTALGEGFAHVSREGIYRLDRAALANAGLIGAQAPLPPARLSLDGAARGLIRLPGEDAYVFVADLLRSAVRPTDAYRWRVVPERLAGAVRTRSVRPPPAGAPVAASFRSSVNIEEHHMLYPGAEEEHRFPWGFAFSGAPATRFSFALPGLADGAVHLTVQLLGITFDQRQSHRAAVAINGTPAGEVAFDGIGPVAITTVIPAGVLRASGNELALTAAVPIGAAYDLVALVSIDASYDRAFVATDDQLELEVSGEAAVELRGFSRPPVLLDVTDRLRPVLLTGASVEGDQGAVTVRFSDAVAAQGTRRYLAAVPRTPEIVEGSRAAEVPGGSPDYVAVVGPGLEDAVKPLLELRRSQGLTTALVPVEALYDRFAHGQHGPEAIRRYLTHLRRPPRHLVLVGDATIDPRNFLGTGAPDLVPTVTMLTRDHHVYAASDAALVTDRLGTAPPMAVGRLPARDPAELAAVIGKIIAFEREGGAAGRAVFVADDLDPTSGTTDPFFRTESDRIAASFPGVQVQKVQLPGQGQADLLAALAEGPDLVAYHGHASGFAWSARNLLAIGDLPRLPEANPFLLVTVDCWDGLFAMPWSASLSEALVLHPRGGAVAALAASSVVARNDGSLVGSAFFGSLADRRFRTLGDWLRAGQRALVRDGAATDLIHVYNLLGDPATRLPWR